MRRIVFVSLLLSTAALAAQAGLAQLKLDEDQISDALLSLMRRGEVPYAPQASVSAARLIPPAQRAAAVEALGAAAKAVFRSATFRARWAEARRATLPEKPRPARSGKEVAAEQRAEMAKARVQLESSLAALPPAQQKELRASMEAAVKAQEAALDEATLGQMEQLRFEQETRDYEEALSEALPERPEDALRLRLEALLADTEGVEFAAPLKKVHGGERFVDPKLEEKPAAWKACYRAGPEACRAGRAFARTWVTELSAAK